MSEELKCDDLTVRRQPSVSDGSSHSRHGLPETDIEESVSRSLRIVTGAIKSCIDAHGPITKEWAASAAKRVVKQLEAAKRQSEDAKLAAVRELAERMLKRTPGEHASATEKAMAAVQREWGKRLMEIIDPQG